MKAMRRVWGGARVLAVLAVLSGATGCEKAQREQTPNPAPMPLKDASVIALDARSLDARNDGPEPTVPPPPPTVKTNGKGDCKVAYAPRPTRDPNPVCKIAGGSFMMGSDDPKAAANEKPVRKVTLTPYFIDQFEVTNAQVAHFLNAVGNQCASARNGKCFSITKMTSNVPFILQENDQFRARSGVERLPVFSASVEGAERYCAWVGKRLPTEAEWEFAARHDPKKQKDYRWPWGDKFYPKRAACDEVVCKDGFESTLENENSSDQAPVGTFDGTHGFGDGSSPWGVHDMAGNVSEIMADTTDSFAAPYPDCGTCVDPVATTATRERSFHIRRGPSLGAAVNDASTAVRSGGPDVPTEGFRCAYR